MQRFTPTSELVERWAVPEAIGSIGLRERGGLVAALRTGFAFLDTNSGTLTPIADPEADVPTNRFNGKVDRAGRFWAGTKNLANAPDPTGSLYRLDADLSIHRIERGISCPMASRGAPTTAMYVCDTWVRRIYAYDFDYRSGTVGNRRVLQRSRLSGIPRWPDRGCGRLYLERAL